eukprot:m.81263 g.81263  ORF g.81263 m.81263 type:complete len:238 (+) comp9400_c0_seq3:76-789(+)
MVTSTTVLVAAMLVMPAVGESFNPDRTRFIDQIGSNFLFRGNEPVINKTFAAAELRASLVSAAHTAGHELPANYTITDISFDNPTEFPDEQAEIKYFTNNPTAGRYINWIIVGFLTAPPVKDPKLLKELVKAGAWDVDKVPDRMKTLHEYMTTPTQVPQVIYMHCEAGVDRTGEMSGAYYLKWQNMTLPQALEIDDHIENRNMEKWSLFALEWYCWHLVFNEGFTNLSCGGNTSSLL